MILSAQPRPMRSVGCAVPIIGNGATNRTTTAMRLCRMRHGTTRTTRTTYQAALSNTR